MTSSALIERVERYLINREAYMAERSLKYTKQNQT